MTAEFPAIAAQNTPLLRAIAERPAASIADLAERSGVRADNLNRKLSSLLSASLVIGTGGRAYEVAITKEGERALKAIATWEGQATAEGGQLVRLDPDLIDANPWQPRTALSSDAEGDEQMALSIADKDVLQPITVRRTGERYEQALGHRRVRGAKLAKARGLVPADYGVPALVRDLTDHAMEEIAIVENVQREDLHWMDEAEAYLRLADRGMTATDILRLVGPAAHRKKRSVQDLIQIARGLAPEDKARTRLPEGDHNRLTVEPAKLLVGNRKAKPALDLSPRQACALAELLDRSADPEADETYVPLFSKPASPALITLGDKGLVNWSVAGGGPVALIRRTPELDAWRAEVGFDADRAGSLYRLRAEVVGELAASALSTEARYYLDELNPPEEPASPRVDPKPAGPQGDLLGGQDAAEDDGRLKLKPLHALAVTELAHKLQRGALPIAGGWVRVGDRYALDPLAQQLVYERLVMFMPQAGANAASLTPTAQCWLDQVGVERDGEGLPVISDEALLYRQGEVGVMPGGGRYATSWLNPDPEPSAERSARPRASGSDTTRGCCFSQMDEPHVPGCRAADEASAHAMRGDGSPPRDAFMQGILAVTAEQAATDRATVTAPTRPEPTVLAVLQRLAAAARHADEALANVATRTKVKPADLAPARELLAHALGEAEAFLTHATKESTDAEA